MTTLKCRRICAPRVVDEFYVPFAYDTLYSVTEYITYAVVVSSVSARIRKVFTPYRVDDSDEYTYSRTYI